MSRKSVLVVPLVLTFALSAGDALETPDGRFELEMALRVRAA